MASWSTAAVPILVVLGAMATIVIYERPLAAVPVDYTKLPFPKPVNSVVSVDASLNRTAWKDDPKLMTKFAVTHKSPMIITNSGVKAWPSFNWTFKYLESAVPNIIVKNQTAGVDYLLQANLPTGSHLPAEASRVRYSEVSMKEFVSTIPSPGYTLYHSGPIEDWGEDLAAQFTPTDFLEYEEPIGGEGKNLSRAMIWMGQPGVTAQIHYDQSHNFFTQVLGRKRFWLFAPHQWHYLYPHPSLHPSYRQSQVNFQHPDLETFPSFAGATAWVADLYPGDVLYVPPFWFHRVESISLGLSVSVLSPSEHEIRWAQASWSRLPFGNMKTLQQRCIASRLFLVSLFTFVYRDRQMPTLFARDLFASRYAALWPTLRNEVTLKPPPQDFMDTFLTTGEPGWTPIDASADTRNYFKCFQETHTLPERMRINRELRETVAKVAKEFMQELEEAVFNDGSREILLGDYVETMARYAVGPVNVPLYIMHCLSYIPNE